MFKVGEHVLNTTIQPYCIVPPSVELSEWNSVVNKNFVTSVKKNVCWFSVFFYIMDVYYHDNFIVNIKPS